MPHSSKRARPSYPYVGRHGLMYRFQRLIQRRPEASIAWVAESDGRKYVLKYIPKKHYLNFTEHIWPRLHRIRANIHMPSDTIPNQRILVYKYPATEPLDLAHKSIGLQERRQILKSVLQGLAEIHDRNLVHLDIRPDNLLISSYDRPNEAMALESVQITDLEKAVWLKPGKNVSGVLTGSDEWRSPEANLRAKLNKPSDIFSFGVMCINAVLGRSILGCDEDFEYHVSRGMEPDIIRLQRQMSFFGDEEGYMGLRNHVGDDERLCRLLDIMWKDRAAPCFSYKHFTAWPEFQDENFKEVMLEMMSLDPEKRITAREALLCPWFANVDSI